MTGISVNALSNYIKNTPHLTVYVWASFSEYTSRYVGVRVTKREILKVLSLYDGKETLNSSIDEENNNIFLGVT